ncbi:MAG: efflux RND transporter periplasmic adaptor subunit [Bacteroidota bacterium]
MSKLNAPGRRYGWWIAGGFVLLLLIAIAFNRFGKKEGQKVNVATSEKRTLLSKVTESGEVQPTVSVPVSADVSGEVIKVYTKEGMEIKAGDKLITLRPDNLEAALEQARASLNTAKASQLQAKANLEQARASMLQDSVNLARTQQLFKEKVVSQVDLENARLRYNLSTSQFQAAAYSVRGAKYQIESANATVKQARENLRQTNIVASMDGVITELHVEIGQRVVGTLQMMGTEVLKIADLTQMEVIAQISENDIVNVHLGDSVRVEIDAFPKEVFWGKVTEIAYSASSIGMTGSDQVTNFGVKIGIAPASYSHLINANNQQSPFRPGMTALVDIFTQKSEDVVTVPIQAVTLSKAEYGPDEEVPEVVYVLKDGIAYETEVETGINDDNYIQIVKGLEAGAEIVTGPYSVLTRTLKDSSNVEIETVLE